MPVTASTTTSSSFDVGSGVPSQLVFTAEPAGATGGTAFSTQPIGHRRGRWWQYGHQRYPRHHRGADRRHGDLSGCTSTTTAGAAVFSGCTINTIGIGHVLTASDMNDALTSPSSAFDVTVGTAG